MKFSIVTTFYNNTPEEVEKIKDSILSQTYQKWEWIISDDFSKESTKHVELLKELPNRDSRIKYVNQKSKKEIFWNPQTYATGDVVVLIGADDYISPKTLEIFNWHFIKYPELLFITSEANILNPNIITSSFIDYVDFGSVFEKRNTFPLGWLNMGVPLAWRNIPINFIQDYNLSGKEIVNDYLIHTRLEELGKFIHLPRVFYNCKIRQDSVSRKIDDDNSFMGHDFDGINKIIEERRGDREINNVMDTYNSILDESKAFYYSIVNELTTPQDVSFITTSPISIPKKEKLKQLWSDHNLTFNTIQDGIKYYIIYLDINSDFDVMMEKYRQIEKNTTKQILIFTHKNSELYKRVSESMSNFYWFLIGDFYVIIQNFS